MKPSSNTMLSFYRQMGKVFYAVADADKKVQAQEVEALKRIVKAEWVPIEDSTDQFGTDAAYQIEIVFDWLLENGIHNDRILDDFKRFHEEHHSLFNAEVRRLIVKTAHAIAAAFHGENKAEKALIASIEGILAH